MGMSRERNYQLSTGTGEICIDFHVSSRQKQGNGVVISA